jgi:WD40 repeat protein
LNIIYGCCIKQNEKHTHFSDHCIRLHFRQTVRCWRLVATTLPSACGIWQLPHEVGSLLASSSSSNSFSPPLDSPKIVVQLRGHTHTVWSLAFSQCNNMLASGSHDRSVRLWNINGATVNPEPNNNNNNNNNDDDNDAMAQDGAVSDRLAKVLYTKRTPVHCLQFTRRNLLLGAGGFVPR